jgi:hypothetical protein
MAQQTKMFQTEDLPLFSGPAPRGRQESFDPQPEPRQLRLFQDACPICMGFGAVNLNGKLKRCICNK